MWMAAPPEVHSALLSEGPGPEPLLASAAAWESLSLEYAAAAEEVNSLVTAVHPGQWDGSGADSFAAAHAPYTAWLLQASADSAVLAAQHQAAAMAYSVALAAMPTLAELAANHTAHAALVATNFFGINTIPIAVNEADYLRMWIQAATTMAVYQATAAAAVSSAPEAAPAPPILARPAASLDPGRALIEALRPYLLRLGINPLIRNPLVSNAATEFIADLLENFGVYWDPGAGLLNGVGYESYSDATQPMWYLARGLELIGDSMQMTQNPAMALQYFVALSVFDWPTHVAQLGTAITQSPLLVAAAGGAMLAPAAMGGGFAGLAGLASLPQSVAAPAPALVAATPDSWPAGGMTSTVTTVASAPTGTPGSAPAPAPGTGVASAAPAGPPAAGTGFVPPYALAPPGIGFGSGMASSASAKAQRKAPEPDSAAAAAEARAATRRQARSRRRKHMTQRQYGHEFMDMDDVPDIDEHLNQPKAWAAASDEGAGALGVAGTVLHEVQAEAAGLTTLATDDFSSTPDIPLLPRNWR
ncbi:PPE family protein [Mycobacterium intermedium]